MDDNTPPEVKALIDDVVEMIANNDSVIQAIDSMEASYIWKQMGVGLAKHRIFGG